MFGYIICDKGELRMREYEAYQNVYCGLCRQLKKAAGPLSRLFLSYDMTFLAMTGLALLDRECRTENGRCALHPTRKRRFITEEPAVVYTAAASVLLTYYKLRDDLADEKIGGRMRARLALIPFSGMRRRILRGIPGADRLEQSISAGIRALAQAEQEQGRTLDAYCDCFGTMLSEVFAGLSKEEDQRRVLRSFGYFAGKWIYLMDAADDLEADRRQGRFNAAAAAAPPEDGEKECDYLARLRAIIGQHLDDAIQMLHRAFELLDIHTGRGILENIVYLGMPARQKAVLSQAGKGCYNKT